MLCAVLIVESVECNANETKAFDDNSNKVVVLTVTPDKCISLQQGRTCYSTVTARWHSVKPLDLCLTLAEQVLQCWQQQSWGSHQFEFAAAQSSTLALRQHQQVLTQIEIEVNWVHKASKIKRHWRLF